MNDEQWSKLDYYLNIDLLLTTGIYPGLIVKNKLDQPDQFFLKLISANEPPKDLGRQKVFAGGPERVVWGIDREGYLFKVRLVQGESIAITGRNPVRFGDCVTLHGKVSSIDIRSTRFTIINNAIVTHNYGSPQC